MRTGKGDNRRPRVVVVGGGFAGLSAVRELSGADVDVLLLDRNLYNTFQPLRYQVAAGGLNPGDITYALRAFAAQGDAGAGGLRYDHADKLVDRATAGCSQRRQPMPAGIPKPVRNCQAGPRWWSANVDAGLCR
jgi:glycine/D-amino acid oxidase-like deaminating enzyme